jgi:hypothetical protein
MGGERFRLMASNPLSQPSKDTEPSLDELQRIYDQRSHSPYLVGHGTWSRRRIASERGRRADLKGGQVLMSALLPLTPLSQTACNAFKNPSV